MESLFDALKRETYKPVKRLTHPFTIHESFKHAAADITNRENGSPLADLQVRPVSDLAKDREFYSLTESSDNHEKCKAMGCTRAMSSVFNAQ